jgi:hypothetical protein
MKMLWCWRCKSEMPMLNEDEYRCIHELYAEGMQATKIFRQAHGIPLKNASRQERFQPLLKKYKELTGFTETNPNAVMHHRLSLYGPPCSHCRKPLRIPKAKLCGACMTPRGV